jgi:hypothetical protein
MTVQSDESRQVDNPLTGSIHGAVDAAAHWFWAAVEAK